MADWIAWGAVLLWCLAVGTWGAWGWRSHRRTLRYLIRAYGDNQALRDTALALFCLVPAEHRATAETLLESVLGPPDPDDAVAVREHYDPATWDALQEWAARHPPDDLP